MANNRVRNVYTSSATVVVPPGVTSIRTICERPVVGGFEFGAIDGTNTRINSSGTGNFQMIGMDGLLYAWGYNLTGELGLGTTANVSTPTLVSASLKPLELTGGGNVSYLLNSDGLMYACGAGPQGQLGNNTSVNSSTYQPVTVPRVAKMFGQNKPFFADQNVRSTVRTMYVLDQQGYIWAWGNNGNGQCGVNVAAPLNVSLPTIVPGFTAGQINRISNENASGVTFFLQPDGTLYSVGTNQNGILGANMNPVTITGVSIPTLVAAGTTKFANILTTDGGTAFALDTIGQLWMWGGNTYGQIGTNDVINRSTPTLVMAGTKWAKISNQSNGWVGLTTTGAVYACGYNGNAQLGDGTLVNKSTPTLISGANVVQQIWGNNNYSFYQKTDGTVFGWGNNFYGQLGLGMTVSPQSTPVAVVALNGCTRIQVAPYNATYATLANGQVWSAGANNSGVLGIGSVLSSVPTFSQIGTSRLLNLNFDGANSVLALDEFGRLYGWGLNNYGGVGDGTIVSKSTPTLVVAGRYPDLRPMLPEVRDVAVTPGASLALLIGPQSSLGGTPIGANATKVTLEFFQ